MGFVYLEHEIYEIFAVTKLVNDLVNLGLDRIKPY